jgi:hypothetical protein
MKMCADTPQEMRRRFESFIAQLAEKQNGYAVDLYLASEPGLSAITCFVACANEGNALELQAKISELLSSYFPRAQSGWFNRRIFPKGSVGDA